MDLRTLPRKSGPLLMLTALSVSSARLLCPAQQAQPTTIRCHFGDDPDGNLGWATPGLDDCAWPAAKDGQWPLPPVDSDGFVWVRYHIPVRADASGPLAVRRWPEYPAATNDNRSAGKVYAAASLVGRQGSLGRAAGFSPTCRSCPEGAGTALARFCSMSCLPVIQPQSFPSRSYVRFPVPSQYWPPSSSGEPLLAVSLHHAGGDLRCTNCFGRASLFSSPPQA